MNRDGSYNLREQYSDVDSELERLRAQALFTWDKESDALRRHGLSEEGDLLEAGCGPGFVTRALHALVPRGSLTGIDNDEAMVDLARRHLAGIPRINILHRSATDTGFPPASFDFVTARLLLQHIPNPITALSEFRRVLRAGGRLFVVDIDDACALLLDPEPPFMPDALAAMRAAQQLQGGNRRIGRSLAGLLRDAGFTDVAVDAIVIDSDAVGGFQSVLRVLPVQQLQQLVELQVLTKRQFADAQEFFRSAAAGEVKVRALFMLFVISGSA